MELKPTYSPDFDQMVLAELCNNSEIERLHEYSVWSHIKEAFNANLYEDLIDDIEKINWPYDHSSEMLDIIRMWEIVGAVNTKMLSGYYISGRIGKKDISKILYLQALRSAIRTLINENELTEYYLQLLFVIESDLSTTWWFNSEKKNKEWNYFKFWDIPKIHQPKYDNEDNYPYGHYTIHETDIFNMNKYNTYMRFADTHYIDSDFLKTL